MAVCQNKHKNLTDMKLKKSKEEKQKESQRLLAKLKALPPEELSKPAKWFLENYGKEAVYYDMKAVMK